MMKVRQRIERLEEELLPPDAAPPIVHHINFIDDDGKTTETLVLVHPICARRPVKHFGNRRWGR
jgi:hypothetical protein